MMYILTNRNNQVFLQEENGLTKINDFKAISVSCTWYSTMFVTEENELIIYEHGIHRFTKIPNLKVLSACYGDEYMLFITENNDIYASGKNSYGRLGLVNGMIDDKPTKIPGHKAISVSCGYNHSAFISQNNELFVCGYNNYGQLGIGKRVNNRNCFYQFIKIDNFRVISVSCGAKNTVFITEENELFGCGEIRSVKFKHPVKLTDAKVKSAVSGTDYIIFITENNDVFVCGTVSSKRSYHQFTKIPDFKATSVISRPGYVLFVSENNELFISGNNKFITEHKKYIDIDKPVKIPNFTY